MENILDFSKICRACLLETKNMSSIFLSNVLEMIDSCTDIKVTRNDGLPDQICSQCVKTVTTSFNFKMQCRKSDVILHEMLERIKLESNDVKIDASVKSESPQESSEIKCCETASMKSEGHRDWDTSSEKSCNEKDDVPRRRIVDYRRSTTEVVSDDVQLLSEGKSSVVKRKSRCNTESSDPGWDNDSFKCKVCGKQLVNKYSLSRHMDTHRDKRKHSALCPICKKEFFEKGNLTKHMLRHKGEKKYNCTFCEKGFYELSAMAFHSKKHHSVKPVECKICRKEFTLQIQLEVHMKLHNENRFTCNTCGKECSSNKSLKSHNMLHMTLDPHLCTYCNKWFKYEASLRVHIRRFHQGPIKKEICTVCGKAVTNVKHHMLFVHATNRPYKCNECEMTFAKESFLKLHLRTHSGESRVYKILCPVCGRILQNSTALRIHMRIHTGERPFMCQMCDKSYKTSSALAVHKRSHTGDRPHECSVCHKRFFTKKCVRVHQVVHTGERPFQCKVCGQAFGQKSTLKTHMKIH